MNWRLAIGGRAELPDALRVDIRPVGDVVGDVRALPFADGSFTAGECLHVLEHLLPTDAWQAVAELRRVLAPTAWLEVATPDLLRCAATLLAGDLRVLANIYSPDTQPAQRHRWGYTQATLRQLLTTQFSEIVGRAPSLADAHEVRLAARGGWQLDEVTHGTGTRSADFRASIDPPAGSDTPG